MEQNLVKNESCSLDHDFGENKKKTWEERKDEKQKE